jgi:hypothetical protein
MTKIKNKIQIAKKYFFKTNKGSILAYSLIIIATMIAIAATMSVVTVIEKKGASSTDFSAQAYQTADSGVQLAIKKIATNSSSQLSVAFPSCSVNSVNGTNIAQVVAANDAGLTDSPYTLSFFSDLDGATPINSCAAIASTVQSIKSVGSYKDTVRAIQVAMAASGGGPGTWTCRNISGNGNAYCDSASSEKVIFATCWPSSGAAQPAIPVYSAGAFGAYCAVGGYTVAITCCK